MLAYSFIFYIIFLVGNAHAESINQGVISLVFDDNYHNQYDYAWPLMSQKEIRGTFYIRTSTMGNSGYMNYAELQVLQNAGNEIASHSVTHRDFTSLTDGEIRNECINSKVTLENNGLIINNFAYPGGQTNNHVDSIVDDYYRSGRTAYISPYLIDIPTNQFRIPGFSAESQGNELELLKNMADQISETNSWGIFLFHNIIPNDYTNPYTTSQEDFADFLDYIILNGIEVLTVNQALDLITLSMQTNFGMTSPTSGKYTLGSEVLIEAFAPAAGVGERFVWEGWSGSGSGSYSGLDNPTTITLNGPVSQVALWRHEYLLTVSSDFGVVSPSEGAHWYEAGSEVLIEAFAPAAGVGERFVWEGWSGSGSGSYSGLDNPTTITINKEITQTGSWKKQFLFNFHQDGFPTEEELFITVNFEDKILQASFWIEEGDTAEFSYPEKIQDKFGKQYVLISDFNQSQLMSDSPKTITAFYELQNDIISLVSFVIIAIIVILGVLLVYFRRKNII
jgi:peptidoglycan/xylan/chitin deacetylase (PgdA/CDA1 family)